MLLNEKGETLEEFLKNYDPAKYERPSVTVDMAVFTILEEKLAVLLIKRKNHPFIGSWALPGGFVNMEEDIDAAARRELMEETGVTVSLFQLKAYGGVDRDPRTRVITIAYLALAKEGMLLPKADDDAADAKLFTISILERGQDGRWKLGLSNAKDTLTIQAETRKNSLGLEAETAVRVRGDMGSDHPMIVFEAVQRILQTPEERILPLLLKKGRSQEELARIKRNLYGE